jgi:hypothetical protein
VAFGFPKSCKRLLLDVTIERVHPRRLRTATIVRNETKDNMSDCDHLEARSIIHGCFGEAVMFFCSVDFDVYMLFMFLFLGVYVYKKNIVVDSGTSC